MGNYNKKEGYQQHMILPTKGMRLEGSLERSTQAIKNHQLHARKIFFLEKSIKVSFFGIE